MDFEIKVKTIELPKRGRTICVSDIHGNYDLFKALLDKVAYSETDTLILLGDLWLKGMQPRETLDFIMELCERPNVHALLGNCDPCYEPLNDFDVVWTQKMPVYEPAGADGEAFLKSLPHIIDAGEYVFVHAGLQQNTDGSPVAFAEQNGYFIMKNDAFAETALPLDRWIVTGHWPTNNYCHEIGCYNPQIDRDKRIIAIDGGNVVESKGQLNAFIIENGEFSHASVDSLPKREVTAAQEAHGGELHVTFLDRHIELIEERVEISLYRHLATGKTLEVGDRDIWHDGDKLATSGGTDYWLPLSVGDTVSVVRDYGERLLCKHNGVLGWVAAACIKGDLL